MRLRQDWVAGALALVTLSGAAFADVTVSQSNDPTAQIGDQMASLLLDEHSVLEALPESKLSSLAVGPRVETRTTRNAKAEPAAPVVISYEESWLDAQPAASGDEQWQCLRTALYFESRGETLRGQFAVAEVILNRVDSVRYPSTICGVVQQGGNGGCQFSYNCDGHADRMRDDLAIERAGKIARIMMDGAPRALTTGATHFHTRAVRPNWSHRFPQTAAIGAHIFYRQP
jgi:spore germination cell wall hydrolase CwlJ-like protein